MSDILRTFVSERLQMTNVSWRSRSNRPTRELRRSRSVAKAEPPAFLPYTTFVKFANIHVLPSAPFCCGNMPESGSDQQEKWNCCGFILLYSTVFCGFLLYQINRISTTCGCTFTTIDTFVIINNDSSPWITDSFYQITCFMPSFKVFRTQTAGIFLCQIYSCFYPSCSHRTAIHPIS